jgi:hypothetical protein
MAIHATPGGRRVDSCRVTDTMRSTFILSYLPARLDLFDRICHHAFHISQSLGVSTCKAPSSVISP